MEVAIAYSGMRFGLRATLSCHEEPNVRGGGFLNDESLQEASMSARPPPVPPAARTTKAPTTAASPDTAQDAKVTRRDKRERNLDEQGHQGNIKQNTTNQGYQQDR
jgi:hypothetical protein